MSQVGSAGSGGAFPGIGGSQSDGQRDKQREKTRRQAPPSAASGQLVLSGPQSLQSEFARLKRSARKNLDMFTGSKRQHVNQLLSFKGHRQFLDHHDKQPVGGAWDTAVGGVLGLSPDSHTNLRSLLGGTAVSGGSLGGFSSLGEDSEPQQPPPVPIAPGSSGPRRQVARRSRQQMVDSFHGPPKVHTSQPIRGLLGQ